VVLRCWKWDDGISVGERKDGDLWPNEQLLNDDLVTCRGGRRPSKRHATCGWGVIQRRRTCGPKRACDHDLLQTRYRIFRRLRDEHALARCEPAGFEHDFVTACPHVVDRFVDFGRSEDAEGGGGDGVPRHEGFGKGLGAFHPCGEGGWAEDGDPDYRIHAA